MRCLLQMPPVECLSPVTSQGSACPPGIASIPQALEQDDRDSAVCPSNVGVVLQIRVFFEQRPSFFIRLRPVLTVDACPDLAILRHLVQSLLYRHPNVTSNPVPADSLAH